MTIVKDSTNGRFAVTADPAEHLLAKVEVGPGDCLLWTGYVDPKGYPRISIPGRKAAHAYRVAYELFVGPIPDGLTLDHTCHNGDPDCPGGTTCRHRRCVNPAHLEPVSQRENILRGKSRSAVLARRTHCPNGHPFDDANTYVTRAGVRHCRACKREWRRARALAKAAA